MRGQFEGFIVSGPLPEKDLRLGDHIVVDWSRRSDKGTVGAVRNGKGVELKIADGAESGAAMGRLVNPSILLKI